LPVHLKRILLVSFEWNSVQIWKWKITI